MSLTHMNFVFWLLLCGAALSGANSKNQSNTDAQNVDSSKEITWIGPQENVSIPSKWTEGSEVYNSIGGGMIVQLRVTGFTVPVVEEVASIVFVPAGNHPDKNSYEKTLGRKLLTSRQH